MPKNLYSEQDDEFLRANYLEMSNAAMSEHLGRSVRSKAEKQKVDYKQAINQL